MDCAEEEEEEEENKNRVDESCCLFTSPFRRWADILFNLFIFDFFKENPLTWVKAACIIKELG